MNNYTLTIGSFLFGLMGFLHTQDVHSGQILGRVTDGSSSGVPGVVVRVCNRDAPARTSPVTTQDNGAFRFANLPSGRYALCVQQVPPAYYRVQSEAVGPTIELAQGASVPDAQLRVRRYGSISGRVTDKEGRPVSRASLRLLLRRESSPGAALALGASARSDENGQFSFRVMKGAYAIAVNVAHVSVASTLLNDDDLKQRIARFMGLPAGAAVVAGTEVGSFSQIQGDGVRSSAPGLGAPVVTEPPNASALSPLLEVGEGTELAGIHLVVDETAVGQLDGTLRFPNLTASIPVYLHAHTVGNDFLPLPTAVSYSSLSGRFHFSGIPKGVYHVRVDTWEDNQNSGTIAPLPILWGQQSGVRVGDDPLEVDLAIRGGLAIRGSVRFSGSRPQPNPAQIMVAFDNTVNRRALPNLTPKPDFTLPELVVGPGRYALRTALIPEGWYLASALVGSHDVSLTPLVVALGAEQDVNVDVLLTDRRSSLAGSAAAADGGPKSGLVVVACLKEGSGCGYLESDAGIRRVFTRGDGQYEFPSIRPGAYWVAAFARDDLPDNWPPSMEWAARNMNGTHSITVQAGAAVKADLKPRGR